MIIRQKRNTIQCNCILTQSHGTLHNQTQFDRRIQFGNFQTGFHIILFIINSLPVRRNDLNPAKINTFHLIATVVGHLMNQLTYFQHGNRLLHRGTVDLCSNHALQMRLAFRLFIPLLLPIFKHFHSSGKFSGVFIFFCRRCNNDPLRCCSVNTRIQCRKFTLDLIFHILMFICLGGGGFLCCICFLFGFRCSFCLFRSFRFLLFQCGFLFRGQNTGFCFQYCRFQFIGKFLFLFAEFVR